MVNDIVLGLPHKIIRSQEIEGKTRYIVDPFMFADAAVHAIMHDIETNRSSQSAEHHTFKQGQPGNRCVEYQVRLYRHIGQYQDNCLEIKLEITSVGFAGFMQIVVDSFLEFSVERLGVTRKFRKIHFLLFFNRQR